MTKTEAQVLVRSIACFIDAKIAHSKTPRDEIRKASLEAAREELTALFQVDVQSSSDLREIVEEWETRLRGGEVGR